ncbi:MAG: flippase-like domain-containing protein [Deinococcales bacterium]|nr:flippase-like domain-containing protein [Deinococcales bacterium]
MLRAVALSVVLGLAGLGLVLWWLGEDLTSALSVPLWAYAVGLGLALANYLAGSVRLMLLARLDGDALAFGKALRAYSLGLFSAAITPGSAGQAPAMVLSLVADGVRASAAWSMAVRVWISDLIFLALTLPLSVLLLARSTRLLRGYYPGVVAAGLFVGSLLVVWVLMYRMRWIKAAVGQLLRLPGTRRWRAKAVAFIGRIEQSGKTLWSAPLGAQLRLHLYTAVVYLSTYLTFYVVVAALRPNVPLLTTMAAAQVPMVAASFFPTPGGAGLLEVLAASLVRGEHTAAAVLAWRLLTYYLRMLVGPVLGAPVLAALRGTFAGGARPAEESG